MPNERLIIHGEGFNFLTFASSLHADWPICGRSQEIVSFFFKSSDHSAGTLMVVLTKPCNIYICVQYDRLQSATPGVAGFLGDARSETIQIVCFLIPSCLRFS